MRFGISMILFLAVFGVGVVAQTAQDYAVITVKNAHRLLEIRTWSTADDTYARVAFSPDGSALALVRKNGQVEFFSMDSLEIVREFSGIVRDVDSIIYSSDGTEALFLSLFGPYTLLDVESGDVLASEAESDNKYHYLPADDVWWYVGYDYSTDDLTLFDTLTGEVLLGLKDVQTWDGSGDGTRLLTRDSESVVRVWDIAKNEMILKVPPPEVLPRVDLHGAGFVDDQEIWVNYTEYVTTDDGEYLTSLIQFKDMNTGDGTRVLEGPNFYASLEVDSTHTYALAHGMHLRNYSEQCSIWELASGTPLPCPAGGNYRAVFSPNGDILATSSGTSFDVRIREITEPGWSVAVLKTEPTWKVLFSPDGRFLVTVGYDIHLWAVPSD